MSKKYVIKHLFLKLFLPHKITPLKINTLQNTIFLTFYDKKAEEIPHTVKMEST